MCFAVRLSIFTHHADIVNIFLNLFTIIFNELQKVALRLRLGVYRGLHSPVYCVLADDVEDLDGLLLSLPENSRVELLIEFQ